MYLKMTCCKILVPFLYFLSLVLFLGNLMYLTFSFKIVLSLSQESHAEVPFDASIGDLVLIELSKEQYTFMEDSWFPDKVEVKSPDGRKYSFPIYRWINGTKEHCFREGKGL